MLVIFGTAALGMFAKQVEDPIWGEVDRNKFDIPRRTLPALRDLTVLARNPVSGGFLVGKIIPIRESN